MLFVKITRSRNSQTIYRSCCKVLVDILRGNPALFLAGTSAFFQLAQQEKLRLFDGLRVVVGLRRIGGWKIVGWHSDTPFMKNLPSLYWLLDKMQHKFTSTGMQAQPNLRESPIFLRESVWQKRLASGIINVTSCGCLIWKEISRIMLEMKGRKQI